MNSLIFDGFKILLTASIIFAVAQLSQRDTLLAAVLASVPLVSVLAMIWMNHDGANGEEIVDNGLNSLRERTGDLSDEIEQKENNQIASEEEIDELKISSEGA